SRQPPAEIGNTGKTFLHSLVAQRGFAANAFLARAWGSPFQAAAGLLPGVGPGQKACCRQDYSAAKILCGPRAWLSSLCCLGLFVSAFEPISLKRENHLANRIRSNVDLKNAVRAGNRP